MLLQSKKVFTFGLMKTGNQYNIFTTATTTAVASVATTTTTPLG